MRKLFLLLLLLPMAYADQGYTVHRVEYEFLDTYSKDTIWVEDLKDVDISRVFIVSNYYYQHHDDNSSGDPDDRLTKTLLIDTGDSVGVKVARYSGSVDDTLLVSIQIVECHNEEFYVQRGQLSSFGSDDAYTDPLTDSIETANVPWSWCLINGVETEALAACTKDVIFACSLHADGEDIALFKEDECGTSGGNVRYVVVTFDSTKISAFEKGVVACSTYNILDDTARVAAWELTESFNYEDTYLFGQWYMVGDDGINTYGTALNIADDDSCFAYHYDSLTTADMSIIYWTAIDFGVDARAAKGSELAADWDTLAIYIKDADADHALAYVSMTCDGDGTAFPRPMCRYTVVDDSLYIYREYSGQNSHVEWQVINLPYRESQIIMIGDD